MADRASCGCSRLDLDHFEEAIRFRRIHTSSVVAIGFDRGCVLGVFRRVRVCQGFGSGYFTYGEADGSDDVECGDERATCSTYRFMAERISDCVLLLRVLDVRRNCTDVGRAIEHCLQLGTCYDRCDVGSGDILVGVESGSPRWCDYCADACGWFGSDGAVAGHLESERLLGTTFACGYRFRGFLQLARYQGC